jgi:hypothetical protein
MGTVPVRGRKALKEGQRERSDESVARVKSGTDLKDQSMVDIADDDDV